MFSRKEQLIQKTGEDGIGRFDFLQLLVEEFNKTTFEENKRQVLANLVNFAYDPINYEYFRRLRILDIFLDQLSSANQVYIHFATAGICNSCLDPQNKAYYLRHNVIQLIVSLLSSTNEEIVLDCITTLMFLITPEYKEEITSVFVIKHMIKFAESTNVRLRNLGSIFLSDYCTKKQIEAAKQNI